MGEPLKELIAAASGLTDDDDERWLLIDAIRLCDPNEVWDAMRHLAVDPDPMRRSLAVNILGQWRKGEEPYHEQIVVLLLDLLGTETVPEVLHHIGIALSHRHDARVVAPLAALRRHPVATVREGVAFGLLEHEDDVAVEALIELARDEAVEVRDWATFGLRNMTIDSPDIREALVRNLTDEDPDTRMEAITGLAQRKDERALQPLLEALAEDELHYLVLVAAEAFADPRLCGALYGLRGAGPDRHGDSRGLDEALRRCGCP